MVRAWFYPLRRVASTIDRWLAIHMPLVWRTRLHWVVISTCVTLLFVPNWLGTSTSIWTLSEILIVAGLVIACTIPLTLRWAMSQLQVPVPELRIRRQALLAALNLLATTLMSLPPITVAALMTHRTAEAIPDEVFWSDFDFLELHQFWTTSYTVAAELAPQDRAQLVPALARLRLQTDGQTITETSGRSVYAWPASEGPERVVSRSQTIIKDRAENVAESKRLWRGEGPYFDFAMYCAYGLGVWLLLLNSALCVLSLPRYKLRERTAIKSSARTRTPAWFDVFDRWLTINHPTVWATQAHVFAYRGLLLGLCFQLLYAIGLLQVVPAGLDTLLQLFAIGWPQLLLIQRDNIPVSTKAEWRTVVTTYMLAVLPAGLLAGELAMNLRLISLLVLGVELFLLVHCLLLGMYRSKSHGLSATMGCLAVLSGGFALLAASKASDLVTYSFLLSTAALWLLVLVRFSVGRTRLSFHNAPRWLGITAIACTPFLLAFLCLFLFFVAFDQQARKGLKTDDIAGLILGAFFVLSYPVYLYLLWPPSRTLLNARAQPQPG